MANRTTLHRTLAMVAAIFAATAMVGVDIAEARAGRSGSMGSRGSRTYDAPATTPTAPGMARPMERSTAQPSSPAQPGVNRPGTVAPNAARPASRFGGGFMAGLLGAGLLGALFGAGFFGGLGSLTAILGLLLQVALIGGLIFLALRFFRRRQDPALAQGPAQRTGHGPMGGPEPAGGQGPLGGSTGPLGPQPTARPGFGFGSGATAAPVVQPIELTPADFDSFERLLGEVQGAYNAGEVGRLRTLTTPEMAVYFEEQIDEDSRRGVRAVVTDVKLLQGDLSEAWREGQDEYATVAMRFALKEGVVDRGTGRVLEGDPNLLTEARELWTFRRETGEGWRLSAIQQA